MAFRIEKANFNFDILCHFNENEKIKHKKKSNFSKFSSSRREKSLFQLETFNYTRLMWNVLFSNRNYNNNVEDWFWVIIKRLAGFWEFILKLKQFLRQSSYHKPYMNGHGWSLRRSSFPLNRNSFTHGSLPGRFEHKLSKLHVWLDFHFSLWAQFSEFFNKVKGKRSNIHSLCKWQHMLLTGHLAALIVSTYLPHFDDLFHSDWLIWKKRREKKIINFETKRNRESVRDII